MQPNIHYQANVCGGDFKHVQDCFDRWKKEPLLYRRQQHMFEGKEEVRAVAGRAFDSGELAQNRLEQLCDPRAHYALAVKIVDGERDQWLVMAAYEEQARDTDR